MGMRNDLSLATVDMNSDPLRPRTPKLIGKSEWEAGDAMKNSLPRTAGASAMKRS